MCDDGSMALCLGKPAVEFLFILGGAIGAPSEPLESLLLHPLPTSVLGCGANPGRLSRTDSSPAKYYNQYIILCKTTITIYTVSNKNKKLLMN